MDKGITINRQHFDQVQFEEEFPLIPDEPILSKVCLRETCSRHCTCSHSCLRSFASDAIHRKLPFINIMRGYKWREWLVKDLIAGLSIAVIHIPQGLGFALLTSVSPVYGLYSSLFPSLFYFFFGTSRHNSMGTMAVISLLIGATVTREMDHVNAQSLSTNYSLPETAFVVGINGTRTFDHNLFQIKIATSVTLFMGLWQIGLSLLNLGVISTFMSMTFITGFLAGSAFHIATSQVSTSAHISC